MLKQIDFEMVGKLIIYLREKNNLKQKDLAALLGVSNGAISQWENGSGIKTENLYDLAKIFNISVSELLEGKLIEEEDEDFFQRNFNLDCFSNFEEINDQNYCEALEYMRRCKNVVKRIMSLFPKYRNNTLTTKESDEFKKLFRYFDYDYEYARSILATQNPYSLLDIIDSLTDEIVGVSENELDYELYKLLRLKPKINISSALAYKKDDTLAKEYLEFIGKERKDCLLTEMVSKMDDSEIEFSLEIFRLVESGARCLDTASSINKRTYFEVELETLNQCEGIVKEDSCFKNKYDSYKKEAESTRYLDGYQIYNWKNYGKDGYEVMIDYKATAKIRDLVLLKTENPYAYYQKLVQSDQAKLGK